LDDMGSHPGLLAFKGFMVMLYINIRIKSHYSKLRLITGSGCGIGQVGAGGSGGTYSTV
jgi:hypothetical protein